MHWPKKLKRGDKVALIAPSSPVESHDLVESAKKYLEGLGFEVALGESCYASYGYLSGTDEMRARDINWAFSTPDINGIFCLRGGYGMQRILNQIDFDIIANNSKFFSGYSDITALHTAINQQTGLITFHSPMPGTLKFAQADLFTKTTFQDFIFGVDGSYIYKNPTGFDWCFLNQGEATGKLCGGNLSIITSSIGTPYEIDTKGKILFIEEVDEEPYKIDRMLNQLHLAGKLKDCVGIVFGDFADCDTKEPAKSLTILEIINNLNLTIPILYNFRCGHCYPTATLPMGAMVRLDSDKNSFEVIH